MNDQEIIGEIRSLVAADDIGYALATTREIENPDLRESMAASMCKQHNFIPCPYCGTKGGWSGDDPRYGVVDVDCELCECNGYVSQERYDEALAWEREMHARMEAERSWEIVPERGSHDW